MDDDLLRKAKRNGFSDKQLAYWWDSTEMEVRQHRKSRGVIATFKQVDTCAAEFPAFTPYYYSTYESGDEAPPAANGQALHHDSGQRTESHRTRH